MGNILQLSPRFSHLLRDAHVEVVKIAVAAVRLPDVLTAVGVLAYDGDGVEGVRLPMIVTNACHRKLV